VNGTKVQGSQLLSRADVIKAGTEEFRFYADVAVPPPIAKPAPPAAPSSKPAAPPPPQVPARAALATIVVSEGPKKGVIFEIHTPLTHIGRGAHNDIVLDTSESVSDTHAKIQRRDDGWYVVDAGSTNGTYVGGTRIIGERRLEGSPDLRFADVKTVFRSAEAGATEGAGGTRAMAQVQPDRRLTPIDTGTAPVPTRPPVRPTTTPIATPKKKVPLWVWIAVVVVVGGAVAFLLLGRTA
jgi:hypothetical protein